MFLPSNSPLGSSPPTPPPLLQNLMKPLIINNYYNCNFTGECSLKELHCRYYSLIVLYNVHVHVVFGLYNNYKNMLQSSISLTLKLKQSMASLRHHAPFPTSVSRAAKRALFALFLAAGETKARKSVCSHQANLWLQGVKCLINVSLKLKCKLFLLLFCFSVCLSVCFLVNCFNLFGCFFNLFFFVPWLVT